MGAVPTTPGSNFYGLPESTQSWPRGDNGQLPSANAIRYNGPLLVCVGPVNPDLDRQVRLEPAAALGGWDTKKVKFKS